MSSKNLACSERLIKSKIKIKKVNNILIPTTNCKRNRLLKGSEENISKIAIQGQRKIRQNRIY
jgi:hypothetical protein